MTYEEFAYCVMLMVLLADRLLPEAHLWAVLAALLLVAIRRENTRC